MKADKDTVVSLHYSLSDEAGAALESSRDSGEPIHLLLGHGQMLPAVEEATLGHEAGEQFAVDVAPEDGYGERQEGLIRRVPKKYFRDAKQLKPGDLTVLALRQGGVQRVTVHKVGMSTIDVDVNHPLAGKALHFEVELLEVREATPEELAHGHAHPPGTAHDHA